MKVGIVGGGVIGLTTGVVLAEAGHDVRIMTREAIEQSTSWAAGAVCYPFGVEESKRVVEWALHTFDIMKALIDDPDAGIYESDWQKLSKAEVCEAPFWLEHFEGGRILREDECPAPYRSGIAVSLLLFGVDEYVPYLVKRFEAAGGVYEIQDVESLDAVSGDFDVLVNSSGVHARDFSADMTVYPARGQVVIVKNPGVQKHTALSDQKFYIYPRGEQCLLGGSFDEREWDRTPDETLTQEILEWAAGFDPLLVDAEVLDVRVGLRPMRPEVRLEKEVLSDHTPVVHNYGHGGAGYTLSWGCAEEVLKTLQTL